MAFTEHGLLQLGKIEEILWEGDDVVFRCEKLKVVRYDEHVAAYEVKDTEEYTSLLHSHIHHHPLALYGGIYVVEHHLLQKPSKHRTQIRSQVCVRMNIMQYVLQMCMLILTENVHCDFSGLLTCCTVSSTKNVGGWCNLNQLLCQRLVLCLLA